MNLVSEKPSLGPDPDSVDPPSSALYTGQHFVSIPNIIAQLLAHGPAFSVISKQIQKSVSHEVACEIEMK